MRSDAVGDGGIAVSLERGKDERGKDTVKLGCLVTAVNKVHNIGLRARRECDAGHCNSVIPSGS
ncbi:hypothetical protein TUSST3_41490 [Streptomyces sp. TUS-ST3]|nr:hypothetical protein TUSST3_41490 [Streptomyces sp. TUS-ST3]